MRTSRIPYPLPFFTLWPHFPSAPQMVILVAAAFALRRFESRMKMMKTAPLVFRVLDSADTAAPDRPSICENLRGQQKASLSISRSASFTFQKGRRPCKSSFSLSYGSIHRCHCLAWRRWMDAVPPPPALLTLLQGNLWPYCAVGGGGGGGGVGVSSSFAEFGI